MSKCLSGYFQSDQFSQRLQVSRVALWMSKCQPRLGLEMIQEQACLPQSPSARPSTPLTLTSPAKTNLLSTAMLSCLVCSSNCRERTMRAFQGQKIYRHDFDQKLTRLYLVVGNTRENSMKFEYAMGITIRYNAAEMKWQISIYDEAVLRTNGSSGAPLNSFALGKHSWRKENDSSECSGDGGEALCLTQGTWS